MEIIQSGAVCQSARPIELHPLSRKQLPLAFNLATGSRTGKTADGQVRRDYAMAGYMRGMRILLQGLSDRPRTAAAYVTGEHAIGSDPAPGNGAQSLKNLLLKCCDALACPVLFFFIFSHGQP
jgi:hypothetical protein